jgi:hypothetical protein
VELVMERESEVKGWVLEKAVQVQEQGVVKVLEQE